MRTRSLRWVCSLLLSLVALSFGAACVDDAAPGGAATAPPTCLPEEGDICTLLEAVGSTSVPVRGYTISTDVKVRWTNKIGDPIPNAEVSWELVSSGAPVFGASITATTSRTDGDGIATMSIRSGTEDASFKVVATAPSAPRVEFSVNVVSKDAGIVNVKVKYEGGIYEGVDPFSDVQVLVFLQGASPNNNLNKCDGFDPYDPIGTLPTAHKVHVFNTLGQARRGTNLSPFTRDDLVTIVAFGRQDSNESGAKPRSWACWAADENNPDDKIKAGGTLEQTLFLKDLRPRYVGVYEVTANFDFLAMVPDNIERWINDFGTFFRTPGTQVLLWLENVVDLDALGPFRGVVAGVLDDLINGLIDDVAPPVIGDIRAGAVDVFDILTNLQVRSEIHFDQEPEPDQGGSNPGVLVFPKCADFNDGACPNYQEWVEIGFNWRNSELCANDPDPGKNCFREYGIENFGVDAVHAEFDAHTTNFWALTMEPHSIALSWGNLVIFAVEKIVLPMFFGPDVDGLDSLAFRLVGGPTCQGLGEDLSNDCKNKRTAEERCCCAFGETAAQALSDFPGSQAIVQSACKVGVPLLANMLKEQLIGEEVDSGDAFQLSTTDAADPELLKDADGNTVIEARPCTLYDENPTDLTVDKFGTPEKRCSWVGVFDAGDLDPIEALWHATRE